jgi:molybdate transport system ATP-binding protein
VLSESIHPLEFDCSFQRPSGFELSLSFRTEGLVTGLIGPSGCGKTTVLNLIAGILEPYQGLIVLGARTLFDSAKGINLAPEAREIGYAFQDYLLFPHLNVLQNLRYGERRTSSPSVSFESIIAVLELTPLLHRYPGSLSGGQRQRVSLGRALLRSPELLLLDEPLSAIQKTHRSEVIHFMQAAIAEFKISTILVSHDHESLSGMAHQVIQLNATA